LGQTFLQVVGQPALSFISSSRYGSLWLVKLELMVALAAMAFILYRVSQTRVVLALGTLLGAGLLFTYALGTHPAAAPGAPPLALSPRLQQAAARPDEGAVLVRRLRLSVGGEIAMALTVFIATALLSGVQTGRQQVIANGVAAKTTTADVNAILRVQPGAAGTNRFALSLFDRTGKPLPNVEKVELRFTYRARDLGESAVTPTARPDGSYSAQGGALVT